MAEAPGSSVVGRPAFPTAPHALHASGAIACWFTDPPGAVVQMLAAVEGTAEMAAWISSIITHDLLTRFPNGEPLILALDMRPMTGREPAARNGLKDALTEIRPRVARAILVPPENASRVYMASLSAATALLSVIGYRVEVARSLSLVIARSGLRAAPR